MTTISMYYSIALIHSHHVNTSMNEANVPIFPVVLGSVEQVPECSEGTPSLVVALGGRGQWVEPGIAHFYSAAMCSII